MTQPNAAPAPSKTTPFLTATALCVATLPMAAAAQDRPCYDVEEQLRFCPPVGAYTPITDDSGAPAPGRHLFHDAETELRLFSATPGAVDEISADTLATLIPAMVTQTLGLPDDAATVVGAVPTRQDDYDTFTVIFSVAMEDGTQRDYVTSAYLDGDTIYQMELSRMGVLGQQVSGMLANDHITTMRWVDIAPFNAD